MLISIMANLQMVSTVTPQVTPQGGFWPMVWYEDWTEEELEKKLEEVEEEEKTVAKKVDKEQFKSDIVYSERIINRLNKLLARLDEIKGIKAELMLRIEEVRMREQEEEEVMDIIRILH